MDVTVVVCTHNRAEHLRAVLEDLAGQQGLESTHWEVLVVDNNSTDETAAVVRQAASDPRFVLRYTFEGEPGKSRALNRGIDEAGSPIIAFTDDDVRVSPGWLAGLLAALNEYGCAGVGGPVIPLWTAPPPPWLATQGPYQLRGPIVDFQFGDMPGLSVVPIGANSAFRRNVFAWHGGFRTDLGHVGRVIRLNEDTEFGRRLLRGGEDLRYAPQAIVHHPVEAHRLSRHYFLEWYLARGRAATAEEGDDPRFVRYAGVPRYLIRRIIGHLARWMTTVDRRRRFYFKAQTYQDVGAISEAWRARLRAGRRQA